VLHLAHSSVVFMRRCLQAARHLDEPLAELKDSPSWVTVVNPARSIGPKDASEDTDPGPVGAWLGRETILAKGLDADALVEEPAPDMISGRMG
jgi:hypothetical protein